MPQLNIYEVASLTPEERATLTPEDLPKELEGISQEELRHSEKVLGHYDKGKASTQGRVMRLASFESDEIRELDVLLRKVCVVVESMCCGGNIVERGCYSGVAMLW